MACAFSRRETNSVRMKITAAITAVQGYVPDYILTNAELETMVDTTDEWIIARTGIRERHIQREPGKATSDMATEAVKLLLAKKNLHPNDIDIILVATTTPDMLFPSTACVLADKIGALGG